MDRGPGVAQLESGSSEIHDDDDDDDEQGHVLQGGEGSGDKEGDFEDRNDKKQKELCTLGQGKGERVNGNVGGWSFSKQVKRMFLLRPLTQYACVILFNFIRYWYIHDLVDFYL